MNTNKWTWALCDTTFHVPQELLNNNSPKKKRTTSKRSVPQPTDNVHSLRHKDARGEQAAEEAAGRNPAWFHPQEEQQVANSDSEIKDPGSEEADGTNQNSDMDGEIKIDNMFGMVEQSSNQSWTRRESQGAACASISLQQKVDFNALAQEEKIAQMKAKLRQREAALNNLHSS